MYTPAGWKATAAGITRLCPDCQVASTESACWLCGVVVTDPALHGAVSIRNPSGPLPSAVGTSLDL
jgi:hypothetical protein